MTPTSFSQAARQREVAGDDASSDASDSRLGGGGKGLGGGGKGPGVGTGAKKGKPAPASGAVPLNVRNARRNAGDGDDHFPEDGAVGAAAAPGKGKRNDGTRQNFDKRTARMKNARHFRGAIEVGVGVGLNCFLLNVNLVDHCGCVIDVSRGSNNLT